MPTYSYKCRECGHEFESIEKIANMNAPCEKPCPECSEIGIDKCVSSARIVAGVATNFKTPEGFKDVLREIHRGAGKHSKIDV